MTVAPHKVGVKLKYQTSVDSRYEIKDVVDAVSTPVRQKKQDASKTMQDRVVEKVGKMSPEQIFELLRAAGIYTKSGKLTARYRS